MERKPFPTDSDSARDLAIALPIRPAASALSLMESPRIGGLENERKVVGRWEADRLVPCPLADGLRRTSWRGRRAFKLRGYGGSEQRYIAI